MKTPGLAAHWRHCSPVDLPSRLPSTSGVTPVLGTAGFQLAQGLVDRAQEEAEGNESWPERPTSGTGALL